MKGLGSSCIFLADTLIKLVTASKLEEDKEFGIKGFRAVGEIIKSRNNEAGRKMNLIYSQSEGYDNILTNFQTLKDLGYVKGGGRGFFIDGLDSVKFTQKTFKEKYLTNPELKKHFDKLVFKIYDSYLSAPPLMLIEEVEKGIFLANDNKYYTEEGELIEDYTPKKKTTKKK